MSGSDFVLTPGSDWEYLGVTWTGPDGSIWDLAGGAEGVKLMAGVRGFGPAPTTDFITTSPALNGGRYIGYQIKVREIFLPVRIATFDGTADFLRIHRAFMSTMKRDQAGTLAVSSPEGVRTITARYYDDSSTSFEMMPTKTGRQTYTLYLHAPDPFWHGNDVTGAWLPPVTAQDVYDAPGGDVFITQGKDTSNATVTNPGDFESYPVWIIDGYTPAAAVGVGGQTVQIPFPVPSGQCLILNTDPTALTATMYDVPYSSRSIPPLSRVIGTDLINPADMTLQLGAVQFASIPPGTDTPLSLMIMGDGLVSMRLPTLYDNAF